MFLNVLNTCLMVGLVAIVTEVISVPHCCISKRFYGEVHIVRGEVPVGHTIPIVTKNDLFIEFDADLQMEFLKGTFHEDQNNTVTTYIVWNDFKNHRKFSIINGGKCQMEQLTDDLTPYCVPSELHFEGTAYFGSGEELVEINSYAGISSKDGLLYSMQTEERDCTPVSMARLGNDKQGNHIIEETNYYNVKQYEHSDYHVFNIPAQCANLITGH